MDATKGKNEAGQLWDRWRQFQNAFVSYELLLRNFLRNEVFSDLILPENFETEPEEVCVCAICISGTRSALLCGNPAESVFEMVSGCRWDTGRGGTRL